MKILLLKIRRRVARGNATNRWHLGLHDVIINGTGNPEAGAYITESIFNKIKEAHKKDA